MAELEQQATTDTIENVRTLRETQRAQIMGLYHRGYELLEQVGVTGTADLGDEQRAPITSVIGAARDTRFRLFMLNKPHFGKFPSKHGDEDSPERQITVELLQPGSQNKLNAGTMGHLRISTKDGLTEELGSTIFGKKVDDLDIMTDHSEGIGYINQIFTKVFNI